MFAKCQSNAFMKVIHDFNGKIIEQIAKELMVKLKTLLP